ncbi:MAG: DMT family transporter [Cytophagaceae bacterium]|jgi:drug/metabolite transporter (DMT)-like permease|nr:DMT family transporter [Cytophagaceae bacterium]
MNNTKAKGYVFGAIAAASYGMNPLFALPLYKAGMNPDSVLFFRYLIAIPILGVMIKVRGRNFKLKRKEIIPLIVMGLLVATSSLTLFQSYNYMDAGVASTLLFVYPVMVALIMVFGYKEKMTLQSGIAIFLALGGIALLYRGEDGTTLSLTGTALVMASSLSYAIYIVGVNQSTLKDVATVKLTFYALLFGLSLFFVRVDFGASLIIADKWYLWGNLLALAVFPTVISFLCTTKAIQCIGSTPTAILGALEPVTAVFFGVAVFGELLTSRLLLGIILIIVAVIFIIKGSNIKIYMVRFRKLFPKLPPNKRNRNVDNTDSRR